MLNYNTTLFYQRDPGVDNDGTVVASGRGAASIAALLPTVLLRQAPTGLAALSMATLWDTVGSVFLFLSAGWSSLLAAYLLFIAFYAWMSFLYSLGSGALACLVSTPERTGLVFTFNAFGSLVLQVVTQSLMGHQVFKLQGDAKFNVLGVQLALVAAVFLAVTIATAGEQCVGGSSGGGGSGSGGGNKHVKPRSHQPRVQQMRVLSPPPMRNGHGADDPPEER